MQYLTPEEIIEALKNQTFSQGECMEMAGWLEIESGFPSICPSNYQQLQKAEILKQMYHRLSLVELQELAKSADLDKPGILMPA